MAAAWIVTALVNLQLHQIQSLQLVLAIPVASLQIAMTSAASQVQAAFLFLH